MIQMNRPCTPLSLKMMMWNPKHEKNAMIHIKLVKVVKQ
jgi:hypothetical protein